MLEGVLKNKIIVDQKKKNKIIDDQKKENKIIHVSTPIHLNFQSIFMT